MLCDIKIKCVLSNHSDFQTGKNYRVGEFGYVMGWCIDDDFTVYKKWNDESSGIIAIFEEVFNE